MKPEKLDELKDLLTDLERRVHEAREEVYRYEDSTDRMRRKMHKDSL